MKCGDIVKNNWAGKNNPIRYFIFIKNNGKYAQVVDFDGKRLRTSQYYMSDLKNIKTTHGGKPAYEVMGHIDLIGFIKNPLIELLNEPSEQRQPDYTGVFGEG